MQNFFEKCGTCAAIGVVAVLASGCRSMQIHELERRVDKLEARVAVLEAHAGVPPAK